MLDFIKLYRTPLLFALISVAFYTSFAYDLDRSDFIKLITLYAGLFYLAYLFIEKWKLKFSWLLGFGIISRLLFLVAIPNLSQDFYRFIWDGRLLFQGINPYLFTPEIFLNTNSTEPVLSAVEGLGVTIEQANKLYEGMGALNASHFSNYPPVNQLCFAIAALFAGKSILGSVIIMRFIIILADVGILYFGRKLLKNLNLNPNNIFWYFLNPFIIIEMTGNLHFESVMLFFVTWSLYLLHKRKWFWAAILLGISVSVKLLPLLFLPLFFQYFSEKKFFKYGILKLLGFYTVVLAVAGLTFLPFLSSEFITNFSTTLALWFQNFEFNASVYYIIRWVGFQINGYNIIETVGKILPLITIAFLLFLTFFRKNISAKNLIVGMLFGVSVYFLFSTTVHPWYIATPLLLSVFTKYKFPIIWSFVVMLSYSAYGTDGFSENLWLVALEYLIAAGYGGFEIWKSSCQVSSTCKVSKTL